MLTNDSIDVFMLQKLQSKQARYLEAMKKEPMFWIFRTSVHKSLKHPSLPIPKPEPTLKSN
jgi:hypothetical protein